MNNPQLLLTAGSGKTSTRIAELLTAQGYTVRKAMRSPRSGQQAIPEVEFDWYRPETFAAAVEGMNTIYLVAPIMDMHPEKVMIPFIEQALAAGTQRLVMLSSASIEADGPVFGTVQQYIMQHAPEWAILRPSYFMQNFTEAAHGYAIRAGAGITTATGDGKLGFVDAEDIARVAVHALTDEQPHNTDHIITGPESLSYGEAAAIISHLSGLDVQHHHVGEEQLYDLLLTAGMQPDYARFFAGLDTRIRTEGIEDQVTDTVLRITGQAPRSLEAFIRDNLQWYAPVTS
ncbi:NAD(P)H-binding protein [Paenibacillus dauci]|uniref:NAD(P)H-binding protein n=1 Tax=Paenibacillus dauci TaxID=1567106 RepID=UPI00061A0875|nr:NAD(P)H-binding protein [Paenibacillus dauci]